MKGCRWTVRLLLVLLLALLFLLLRLMRRSRPAPGENVVARQERVAREECVKVPAPVYRRPDPLIYSQRYLMSQGLAVTWDNPDIQLFQAGVPVPSHTLAPATEYEIVARIWNGSTDAPAVNLPVRFSYLTFGIGTTSTFIGETRVDLPVRGAPGHPTFARVPWRTPAAPGHYCIQVDLIWSDDANPANNLGQENVNVKPLNSPHAVFTFPVRNDANRPRTLRLAADSYRLGAPVPCEPQRPPRNAAEAERQRAARRAAAQARHDRAAYPVPPGWRVALPGEVELRPGEERVVTVDITAPDGFVGERVFNVNAWDENLLVGGVTLTVHS